MADTAVLIII